MVRILVVLCLAVQAFGQVSKTVNCVAGTLNALTSSYQKMVTNLVVTGTVDAQDFVILRDSMPLLANLDMASVTIKAYTGTKGTNGTSNTVYNANTIPQRAFSSKKSLLTYVFPTTITAIGDYSFSSSKLTSLAIPSTVTSIGNDAFYWSSFNGNLVLPNSLISIGDNAFTLSEFTGPLVIPNSVTSIGSWAFYWCDGLTKLTLSSSMTRIEDHTFYLCSGLVGDLVIPESVTFIGSSAFGQCGNLEGKLTLPSKLQTISSDAFYSCDKLAGSVTIPASVTSIGSGAFHDFSPLINVDPANINYSSLDGVLFSKDKTKLIQCPVSKTGTYTIPSTVQIVGANAFSFCDKITGALVLPSTLTSIERGAFYASSFTGSIIIPKNITTISELTFAYCYSLKGRLDIAATVTSIGNRAFESTMCNFVVDPNNPNYASEDSILFNKDKTKLIACPTHKTKVIIPASVTSFEGSAFSSSKMTSLKTFATTPIDLSPYPFMFSGVTQSKCALYVPVGTVALYAAATEWKDFSPIIDTKPSAPVAKSATSINSTSFVANWETSAFGVKYFIDVASDSNFTNILPAYTNLELTKILYTTIKSLEKGSYYYRVRAANDLGISENSNVIKVSFLTAIEKDDFGELICMYPNPAIHTITISGLNAAATIQITDLYGKVMHTENTNSNTAEIQINIAEFPKGIYQLILGQKIVNKFVVF